MAHRIALSSKIAGIINCPINKELLNKKIWNHRTISLKV